MTETAEERFIETMGAISHAEGRPRIAGQIVAFLVLAGEARSLGEIAEALGVSKASISTNIRLLEAKGTTVREGRKGSRQDLWRVVREPHSHMLRTMAERFHRNAAQIGEIGRTCVAEQPETAGKIVEFADFYENSADFLEAWADRLDQDDLTSA